VNPADRDPSTTSLEDWGYDGFFRADHLVREGTVIGQTGPTDLWVTLAGLARQTTRIWLGSLMCGSTFRNPAHLAIIVAQVGTANASIETPPRSPSRDDAGAERVYLQLFDLTDLDQLQLFAEDVLPHFANDEVRSQPCKSWSVPSSAPRYLTRSFVVSQSLGTRSSR
jgi:hypothetical protein